MSKKPLNHFIWVIFVTLIVGNFAMAEKLLRLSTGLMTTGGNFVIPYSYDKNNIHKIELRLDPRFGYFIIDGLQISAKAIMGSRLYWSKERPPIPDLILWGAGIGAHYYFDLGLSIFPYVAVEQSATIPNASFAETVWNMEFPVGLLWALNKYAGLNFGINTIVELSLMGGFESVKIVPGYFGISAFF